MPKPAAILDACVLYPAPVRDLLMYLALAGLFCPKWTDRIHEEWIRSVLEDRPDLTRRQLDRTKNLMNSHIEDCLVEGYEGLVEGLSLPDPDDRHVLAAAIRAEVSVIVTRNLRDFPPEALNPSGIRAEDPDTFLGALFDQDSEAFLEAVRRQRRSLQKPPKSPADYLETLRQHGLGATAERLRLHIDTI